MKGKAKSSKVPWAIVAIILLVVGFAWYQGVFSVTPSGGSGQPSAGECEQCPDDAITTDYVRQQDDSAATDTFFAGDAYLISGSEVKTGYLSSSGYPSSGIDAACCASYKLYIATNASASGGTNGKVVTNVDNEEYVTAKTNAITEAQVRVKDLTADSYHYMIRDGNSTGVNQTTYETMDDIEIYGTTTACADISVGTDGSLDYEIYIRADTARQYFGDQLGKCYVFVDVGSDVEWDAPTVSWNGKILTDTIGSVNANDLLYSELNAMDYAYYIGMGKEIDYSGDTLGFAITAASGQDPDTSNDDITIYFGCEGVYKSSQETDTFKIGIANDATTRAAVVHTSTVIPKINFNIA